MTPADTEGGSMASGTDRLKSDQILEHVKRLQRAREVVDVDTELVKVVVFTSGIHRFALYGSTVREILPPTPVAWVPGLPPHLPGLINVRGDIESVLDLRSLLGQETVPAESCLVAMVTQGSFRSGILVDAIEDVRDIPVSAVHPPLSTLSGIARELAAGAIDLDGLQITLLDTEKLATRARL